jgi:hypothetical protein
MLPWFILRMDKVYVGFKSLLIAQSILSPTASREATQVWIFFVAAEVMDAPSM